MYRLNWVCPLISQKEIEALFTWVNGHLSTLQAVPLTHFSKLSIQPLTKPLESLHIQFPLILQNSQDAETIRGRLWSEVLSPDFNHTLPYALSLSLDTTLAEKKKLVVFDMDSTLINQEVIDELARIVGLYDQVAAITERAMKGELTFTDSLTARCRLLKGISIHQALNVIPSLSLSPGAETLLASLRSQGVKTAVVSGGFQFILSHFQKQCFMDHAYGNDLERDDEDQFTGNVLPPIVDGEYKQKLVANLKKQYSFSAESTVIIGDGANDLWMMKEGSTQVSFCGKPKLSAVTNTLILDRNLLWILPLI